jgi:hypothetical protein
MAGIIIEPLKAVYWFMPKNACTTLKAHYANMLGLGYVTTPHEAAFEYTDDVLDGYFNFCIVRHPLRRLYSCWANKIAEGHPVSDDFIDGIDIHIFKDTMDKVYSGMPFSDFVDVVLDAKHDPHWAPQSEQSPEGIAHYKLEELPLFALFPIVNKDHTGGNWRSAYSNRTITKAVEYYREDFERYGYQIA